MIELVYFLRSNQISTHLHELRQITWITCIYPNQEINVQCLNSYAHIRHMQQSKENMPLRTVLVLSSFFHPV